MTTIKRVRRSPAIFLSWLLVGGLVALLAACNQPSETPTPVAGEPVADVGGVSEPPGGAGSANTALPAPTATFTPEPVSGRLVLWHSWAEGDGDALAEILGTFQRDYPDVTVDTLFVAYNDLAQSYADAVAGGGGPDLLLAPNWWLGGLADAGAVLPLDGQVSEDELTAYWPAAVDNLRWNGQLYGLPTNFEVVSFFVNSALVDPASVPATTDALLAQAQQTPTQGMGLYNNFYHLYWGIPAYGGRLFDDNGVVVLEQSGDAAGYLAWLKVVSQTEGSYVDTDYGMLLDRFKKGEFAYFVDGPWSIDELKAALGDTLAVALLPAGPSGPAGPWLNADGVFLNPQLSAEQQRLALLLARHFAGPESGSTLARVAKRLPANRGATPGADALLQGFMKQAASAQPMPGIPEMEHAWGYGGDMIIKVIDGDADALATVQESAALINEANGK